MTDEVVVFGEQYAVTPEWILYSPLSDRAIRLYGVLGRYVGTHDKGWPSRAKLGERMNCSTSSVDRAVVELEKFGAIRVEERRRPNGSRTSSYFYLLPNPTRDVRDEPNITRDEGASSPVTTPDRTLIEGTLTNVSSPTDVGGERKNRKNEYTPSFEAIWKVYPRKIGKLPAFKAFKTRLKQGESEEDLTRAVEGYIFATKGQEERYILHGETFFGPNEKWKDYLGGSAPVDSLSPDQKNVALIFDCYDQGGEWFNPNSGEFSLDNPAVFSYTRPRDFKGNLVDADGRPYKLTAQGQRVRTE